MWPMALSASKRLEVAIAIVCFLAGVSIYLLWRDEHLLIHRILHGFGIDSLIEPLRNIASKQSIPEWVRFALPDGLWSLSYILIIDAWVKRNFLWTAVIPAIGFLSELMQLAGWLPGTIDVCDLIAYALPYLLYVLIINPNK